jgi:2-polyprenyl-3-methyl-5-hydroxy-6-metoxy-1,4-benzoquinol methylase
MTGVSVDGPVALPAELLAADPPEIPTEDVPLCPVCGHDVHMPDAAGYDYESLTCSNRWSFVRCAGCAHLWLNPRPAVSALGTIYPADYYAYQYRSEINPVALRAKDRMDAAKLRGLLAHLDRAPRAFLDVGCGDGRFLELMERRGVPAESCYGLELDADVVEHVRSRGYTAFAERVEDTTGIPDATLDLATMFHVLEHVDDPATCVRRLADWLAPGGVLAIETPNMESLDRRLFRDSWWGGYHFPRHWNLFSPDALAKLLRDAGLDVVETRFQTGHSFWMWSLHHRLRYGRPARPGLARWFNPFRGLPMLAAFTAFDLVRGRLGAKTSAMLMVARRPVSD